MAFQRSRSVEKRGRSVMPGTLAESAARSTPRLAFKLDTVRPERCQCAKQSVHFVLGCEVIPRSRGLRRTDTNPNHPLGRDGKRILVGAVVTEVDCAAAPALIQGTIERGA